MRAHDVSQRAIQEHQRDHPTWGTLTRAPVSEWPRTAVGFMTDHVLTTAAPYAFPFSCSCFLIFGVAFYIAKRQVDASLGERKSTYKMLWQQPEMFPPWFRIYSVLFVLHVLLTFYAQ